MNTFVIINLICAALNVANYVVLHNNISLAYVFLCLLSARLSYSN